MSDDYGRRHRGDDRRDRDRRDHGRDRHDRGERRSFGGGDDRRERGRYGDRDRGRDGGGRDEGRRDEGRREGRRDGDGRDKSREGRRSNGGRSRWDDVGEQHGDGRNGDNRANAGGTPGATSGANAGATPGATNGGRTRGEESYYGHAAAGDTDDNKHESIRPGLVVKGTVARIEAYGAFVDFEVGKDKHRGLVHISQIAQRRVEQVTDELQLGQDVHASVLDVAEEQRSDRRFGNRAPSLRIRLGMKEVNQMTGQRIEGSSGGGGKRGRRGGNTKELEKRADQRRHLYMSSRMHWNTEENDDAGVSSRIPYLRLLWSASPEPAKAQPVAAKKPSSDDKKKAKDSDDDSDDDSSSSSEDESSVSSSESSRDRRKRRKKRGKRRKSRKRDEKKRKKRSSKSDKRSRKRRRYSDSESEASNNSDSDSDDSVKKDDNEKESPSAEPKTEDKGEDAMENTTTEVDKEAQDFKDAVQGGAKANESDEEDEGPKPLAQGNAGNDAGGAAGSQYGGALLPGEGQAIAQFVQQNLRIPRRGEIGYSQDDIEHYEKSGFVMSGSRHSRMNAVRIRKENQVYSAEEQRALALITMEENQQKEAQLMEDFRTMLKEKKQQREKEKKSKKKKKKSKK